jgi:8-oxo-dGTP pyrophosphatase MutT (NUDIX family)
MSVLDSDHRLLLIWRHRFIIDRWGWDVPAEKVLAGEEPVAAAERAVVEETGRRPRNLREVGWFHPSPGISDQRFGVFLADTVEEVGEPAENDVDRLEWVPIDGVYASTSPRRIA